MNFSIFTIEMYKTTTYFTSRYQRVNSRYRSWKVADLSNDIILSSSMERFQSPATYQFIIEFCKLGALKAPDKEDDTCVRAESSP